MKTLFPSLLGLCCLCTSVFAAPEFIQQPANTYAPKNGVFTYSFKVRASLSVTMSYPDGSPAEVFDASSESTEQSGNDNIYTVRITWGVRADEGTTGTFRVAVTDSTGTTNSNPFTGTMVSEFFRFGENRGGGYFEQSTLGLVYAANPPYVYQNEGLGWFTLNPNSSFQVWLYSLDTNLDWMYFTPLTYPWIYVPKLDSWTYFVYLNGGRFFYVQRTDEWISG